MTIQLDIDLALRHHTAGRLPQAESICQQILQSDPNQPVALHLLGVIAHQVGKNDTAVDLITKALTFKPDFAEAHSNLGNALKELGKLDEAVASFHKALTIKPDFAEAHNNLGGTLQKQGKLDEAVASYRKALTIKPDYAKAHSNLGILQLLLGEFQDGWGNYTWRWKVKDYGLSLRDYKEPIWDGSTLEGKTILLYPEQGLGDTIQFARYLPLVEALGARVLVEVQEPLYRLFEGSKFADNLVGINQPLPPFNCHAPLLDLPRLLNTTLETIPGCDSFLKASPELREQWADRIRPSENIRIGVVWAGSPTHKNDRNRSFDSAFFRPLTEIPGVSVYSLQVVRDGESARVLGDKATDIAPFLTDFADTAAMMSNLDLIVSADTSVVHLAGTLGKPVWVLLPFNPDWRWLLERDDSPWYPTMRLFRQSTIGGWAGVFDEISEALHTLSSQDG